MDKHVYIPNYDYDTVPEAGETLAVAPGVHWLRMPLPFQLDHINLWLLEDEDEAGAGWTIIDTGIATDEVKAAWELVFEQHFTPQKPLKRVIVTHFHPDHLGLAGWLTERFDVPLWMPREEWCWGRMLCLDTGEGAGGTLKDAFRKFYHAAGFDADMLKSAVDRAGRFSRAVSVVPPSFRSIGDGERIQIGGREWQVIIGNGHSPEHACLYCPNLDVLISGDQVLPKISPNISVWPQEPEADPLALFLASLEKFRGLGTGGADDTLVLPSHNYPFRGLEGRLDYLGAHHVERLEETLAICAQPVNGVDALRALFKRELDTHQLFFATGEALAHLHYLMGQGKIRRWRDPDGVYLFQR